MKKIYAILGVIIGFAIIIAGMYLIVIIPIIQSWGVFGWWTLLWIPFVAIMIALILLIIRFVNWAIDYL